MKRAEVIHLTAARLIDPAAGEVLAEPAVVIEEGLVTAVGPAAGVAAPKGARRIQLAGQTLLPGLIDMHVHITSRADHHGYNALQVSVPAEAVSGVAHAWISLQAGFTTLRNVGAAGFADVALRDSINRGETVGPRLFVSGPPIGATGGHCDCNLLPRAYNVIAEGVADGPEAITAKVREIHKYGADLIKICATGGVLSKGTTVGGQQLTLQEMKAAVDAAHMLGMKVAAHAHGTAGINDAIRAGVDTIEHCSLADAESFALARERGAVFDMDIYNDDFIMSQGAAMGVLPEMLAKEAQIGRAQREAFRAATRAGVTMTFGTDAGVFPHGDNALQFAKMVEFGMSPMQAIRAATASSAAALGPLGEGLGAIAAGAHADLVAVEGDPLADVRALERMAFVMKAGAVHRLGGKAVAH